MTAMVEAARPLTESSFDLILPAFERALLRENIAPRTVRGYRWALDDLARFAGEHDVVDLVDVDRQLLEHWQDQLRERLTAHGGRLKSSSRSIASTAARRLIRFAADRDIVDPRLERSIVRVRTVQNDPRPLDPSHFELLREHFARPSTNLIALRDRALFFGFITTGARVTEMLQLQRTDYARPVVLQKGGSEKMLRFPPAVVAMIADYVARRRDQQPALWVALGNNVNSIRPLASPGVREIWHRATDELRLPRFTTHQLRHTFFTELVDADVPVDVVAETGGHHDLRTAMRYVRVSERRRQLAVDAAAQLVPVIQLQPRPFFRRQHRRRLS